MKPDIKKEATFFYVQGQFLFLPIKNQKRQRSADFLKKNRVICHNCAFKADKKEMQIVLQNVGRSGQGQTAGRQKETLVTMLNFEELSDETLL